MYKIVMNWAGGRVDMPKDSNLRLFEACDRAEIYKARNRKAVFEVVNEDNGDVEYII